MKNLCLLLLVTLFSLSGNSQPWFPNNGEVFNADILPRVDITINEDSLTWIYDNYTSDKYFKAQFIFSTTTDSDTINDVGFRLRGNTSRGSDKKSFKISFDEYKSGRKYNGLEKMNLNGEHNDPSIIRSHLTWNIFKENYVPGSRSNHVDVYINNRYYGLYVNIEHIDEEFVESRFNNKLGNLYKCTRNVGLEYLGENKEEYKSSGYDLKTNTDQDDYSDLINFINVINNTTSDKMPEDIEPIFNMNGFIRYLVVEIFTGHWDAYSVNSNNYYLYNNAYTGKFEFIPYDLDNTFGIDWFGVDWGTRDIYRWWNDLEDKVLTSKTFGNQIYKDRFSFLLNELITNYINKGNLFSEIDAIYKKIENSAQTDTYRSLDYNWTFDDFKASYTEALETFHVTYGLKPYITQRLESIQKQIELNPIAPIIENVYHNFPSLLQPITIKADITDDELDFNVVLYYSINGSEFQSIDMIYNSGREYNIEIAGLNEAGSVDYYIECTDASNKITREPSIGAYSIHIGTSNTSLSISEFMASNQNTIYDNYGETGDWIEIYNRGTESVNLQGKYLSDDFLDPTKWNFPNVLLQPGDYYLVWADNDSYQGDNHANFKLSRTGEFIGIFDSFEKSYAPIDTFSFGQQETDYSTGKNRDDFLVVQSFITPKGENGNSELAYITIAYNMNLQIADGDFEQDYDFIDVAGSFNNWEGSEQIFDGNNDGLHRATLFGFSKGSNIEYRARINGEGNKIEFVNQGNDGNRILTLESGSNEVLHWFNDELSGIEEQFTEFKVRVYPNPVESGPIKIEANSPILFVELYSSQGNLVKTISGLTNKFLIIHEEIASGVYLLRTKTIYGQYTSKIIVY
jgi:spore coat protein H